MQQHQNTYESSTPSKLAKRPTAIDEHLDEHWALMHRQIKQILSKQEQAHLDSVNSFLQRKEKELALVTGELVYRASQDDYKDLLISKL